MIRPPIGTFAQAFLVGSLAAGVLIAAEVLRLYQGSSAGPLLISRQRAADAHLPAATRVVEGPGYDGQFSLLIAGNIAERRDLRRGLDLPRYRLRRVLMPALVSLAALADVRWMPFIDLAIQALMAGLGTASLSALAVSADRSPWWGACFLLGFGTLVSLWRATADVGVAALLLLALYAFRRSRFALGATALAAAMLTKEIAILAVPAVWLAYRHSPTARRAALLSVAAPAAWWLWVNTQVPPDSTSATANNFSAPMVGWVASLSVGLATPKPFLRHAKDIALLSLHLWTALCAAALGLRALRSTDENPTARAAVLCSGTFALVACFASTAIWQEPWSYGRVLLPAVLMLLVFSWTTTTRLAWAARLPTVLSAVAALAFGAYLFAARVP